MEFTPINTREEFDAAVQSEYGNVADLQGQITTLTGERDAHATTIESLQKELNGYKTAELKNRIAQETGIPAHMASRISGDDEKAMRADAKALKDSLNAFKGADPSRNKEKGGNGGENGLLAMLRGMKGE